MKAYLGVDGGGTKTALCLITDDGQLLARVQGPSCYYLDDTERGIGLVEDVLAEWVPLVCAMSGTTPAAVTSAFFGLPAYGEVSADVAALDDLPRAVLGHERYHCGNDVVCGWAGSLAGADGIHVVAGTGSIAYGRRGEVQARTGGWGEVFGDEGSGHWLGVHALQLFSRMSDGRQPSGPLLQVLRDHLALQLDLDLVDVVINRWHGSRRQVASLSRPLVEAARAGDAAAAELLVHAGAQLAQLVQATRTRLGYTAQEVVRVSYSGGVFSIPEVLEELHRRLSTRGYELRPPRFPPDIGAALHAARLDGCLPQEVALQRLEEVCGDLQASAR
ncbi:N-acetylglucosamine kinase [Kineococcus sp. SYSU DK006]|uniref:N-acetylglucosamine kinase n=1 Tax=Kineococcus sp. SYSU DK006 TaxID=3383127 RepID=UPI003D7D6AAA